LEMLDDSRRWALRSKRGVDNSIGGRLRSFTLRSFGRDADGTKEASTYDSSIVHSIFVIEIVNDLG